MLKFQTEDDERTGEKVLTCYLLPQQPSPSLGESHLVKLLNWFVIVLHYTYTTSNLNLINYYLIGLEFLCVFSQ